MHGSSAKHTPNWRCPIVDMATLFSLNATNAAVYQVNPPREATTCIFFLFLIVYGMLIECYYKQYPTLPICGVASHLSFLLASRALQIHYHDVFPSFSLLSFMFTGPYCFAKDRRIRLWGPLAVAHRRRVTSNCSVVVSLSNVALSVR